MPDEIIGQIERDIKSAAYVDRLLPSVRAPKYKCCMPDIIYTEQEKIFMDKKPIKVIPTKEQLELWEKVMFDWMPLLTVTERLLVWKRANRIPWKLLCRELGYERSQLWRRYQTALIKISFYIKGINVGNKIV